MEAVNVAVTSKACGTCRACVSRWSSAVAFCDTDVGDLAVGLPFTALKFGLNEWLVFAVKSCLKWFADGFRCVVAFRCNAESADDFVSCVSLSSS